jgi:AAA ATPase domain
VLVLTPRTVARSLAGGSRSPAFRLLEVDPEAHPVARRPDAPLVGRTQELAALKAEFEQARTESRCRVVTILGEPGIGKTRLARELAAEVGGEALVLVGRCVSYGEGATWLPLGQMLERAGVRLDTLLESAGSSGEVFLATRRVFEQLAAEQPLLLVFDDVHWAESTLVDLVEYLADGAEAPILCLCLARPELAETRPALATGAVRLGVLTERQAGQLAAAAEPELRAEIVAAAGGNPLFLEQLVAYADETGSLDGVPPSVEALIAARLDLLAPEQLGVLQRAAVVGRLFLQGDVQELGGRIELLRDLDEKGFVRRIRSGFRFHHVLADWLDERGESGELVGLPPRAGVPPRGGAPTGRPPSARTGRGRRRSARRSRDRGLEARGDAGDRQPARAGDGAAPGA